MTNTKKPAAKRLTKAQKAKNVASGIAKIDGWYSSRTGIGVPGYDTAVDTVFNNSGALGVNTLEALYQSNDIASVIIDRIANEALREGYRVVWKDSDPVSELETVAWAEEAYKVSEHALKADKQSRLFGGAAVMIGADDGRELVEPIVLGAPVKFLRVYNLTELKAQKWYTDPASPLYGTPGTYRLQPIFIGASSVEEVSTMNTFPEIHASRLQTYQGVISSEQRYRHNLGWGDSVLNRVYNVLKRFDTSWESVMALLKDASLGVYKVKGFMEMLESGNAQLLIDRMQLIDSSKSIYRSIVLDADGEDFERVATPLTEIANVIGSSMLRVSSAAKMPAAILFGQSPQGMNATGKSDFQNWYDIVRAHQTHKVGPAITNIYRHLLAQSDSPTGGVVPENLEVIFPPLDQMEPTQQADIYAKIAAGDKSYVDSKIYTPAQIAEARASRGNTPWAAPVVDTTAAEEETVTEENE